MIMQTAGVILWDGKGTVAIICDPGMEEAERLRLFKVLAAHKWVWHSDAESKVLTEAMHPITDA